MPINLETVLEDLSKIDAEIINEVLRFQGGNIVDETSSPISSWSALENVISSFRKIQDQMDAIILEAAKNNLLVDEVSFNAINDRVLDIYKNAPAVYVKIDKIDAVTSGGEKEVETSYDYGNTISYEKRYVVETIVEGVPGYKGKYKINSFDPDQNHVGYKHVNVDTLVSRIRDAEKKRAAIIAEDQKRMLDKIESWRCDGTDLDLVFNDDSMIEAIKGAKELPLSSPERKELLLKMYDTAMKLKEEFLHQYLNEHTVSFDGVLHNHGASINKVALCKTKFDANEKLALGNTSAEQNYLNAEKDFLDSLDNALKDPTLENFMAYNKAKAEFARHLNLSELTIDNVNQEFDQVKGSKFTRMFNKVSQGSEKKAEHGIALKCISRAKDIVNTLYEDETLTALTNYLTKQNQAPKSNDFSQSVLAAHRSYLRHVNYEANHKKPADTLNNNNNNKTTP